MGSLIKKYLKGYKLIAALGLFFKLLEAVIELFIPMLVASVIDKGIKTGDMPYVWRTGGLMLALYFLGFGFSITCQYLSAKCGYGYGTNLRRDLYRHINRLPLSAVNTFQASSLVTRVNLDTANTQTAINRFIRLVTRSPFLLIGALIMAVRINAYMSLIFFAAALLIAAALFLVMRASAPKLSAIQKSHDEITLLTREGLSGARVIRAFNKQAREEEEFAAAAHSLKKESLALSFLSALTNPLTYLIVNSSIICILYLGSRQVNSGGLSQGEIVALINYLLQILNALVIIAALSVIFTRAGASAKRINEVLTTPPEDESGLTEIPQNEAALEFNRVCFAYPGNSGQTLNDISFKLMTGQTLGIIGGTGSGKSTLVSLIPRLHPYEGEISFFDQRLDSYSTRAVRDCIGFAPQKAVLFSGTLRENMLLANPNASDEDIMAALKTARAGFISSPDAEVSRGGNNFSGGQKQRLCLARALVKNPRFLILDDSMSALDYLTESAVRRELNKIKDMTKIIVSQRAASVKHADLIVVLEDGMTAGIGTHKELMEACALYREINDIQGGAI